MTEWIKKGLPEIRWTMLVWVACCAVAVWLLGAPAWVAAILAIWIMYKENE